MSEYLKSVDAFGLDLTSDIKVITVYNASAIELGLAVNRVALDQLELATGNDCFGVVYSVIKVDTDLYKHDIAVKGSLIALRALESLTQSGLITFDKGYAKSSTTGTKTAIVGESPSEFLDSHGESFAYCFINL